MHWNHCDDAVVLLCETEARQQGLNNTYATNIPAQIPFKKWWIVSFIVCEELKSYGEYNNCFSEGLLTWAASYSVQPHQDTDCQCTDEGSIQRDAQLHLLGLNILPLPLTRQLACPSPTSFLSYEVRLKFYTSEQCSQRNVQLLLLPVNIDPTLTRL